VSHKGQGYIKKQLPIENGVSALLIKWDRLTGAFDIFYEGDPMSIPAACAVLDAVKEGIIQKGKDIGASFLAATDEGDPPDDPNSPPWLS